MATDSTTQLAFCRDTTHRNKQGTMSVGITRLSRAGTKKFPMMLTGTSARKSSSTRRPRLPCSGSKADMSYGQSTISWRPTPPSRRASNWSRDKSPAWATERRRCSAETESVSSEDRATKESPVDAVGSASEKMKEASAVPLSSPRSNDAASCCTSH